MPARALAVSVLLAVLNYTVCAGEANKLIPDYGGHAGFQSVVGVAKDLKIFEKYGLDAEVIMITGSARSVAALLGGSTQFRDRLSDGSFGGGGERLRHQSTRGVIQQISLCLRREAGHSDAERSAREKSEHSQFRQLQ